VGVGRVGVEREPVSAAGVEEEVPPWRPRTAPGPVEAEREVRVGLWPHRMAAGPEPEVWVGLWPYQMAAEPVWEERYRRHRMAPGQERVPRTWGT
jgi:hypothetical protein